MADDIGKIIKNSCKAELLEELSKSLELYDKAIVILIEDKEDGSYNSQVMTLGLERTYEAYGILDVAKNHLKEVNG